MSDNYLPDPNTNEPPAHWIANRFEIQELVGTGGLGDVFRAWDHHLNRYVAVKRMRNEREESDRTIMEQTWREAMTTACLQHPNIITIFDYGIDELGIAYVVMELIDGETLEVILSRGPLQINDFYRFAEQSLEGIIAAHSIGLIHRDIKPGNFMFTRSESGKFLVKILDFGLAKYIDAPQPQSMDHLNSLMGSIHYMAPEQFQRQPVDLRTDLYSLGCIFYEAVTGHPAFDGDNVSELIDAHLKATPYPIHSLRSEVSPKLENWIMKLISKNPSHRPRSAIEALKTMPTLEECGRRKAPLTTMIFDKLKNRL